LSFSYRIYTSDLAGNLENFLEKKTNNAHLLVSPGFTQIQIIRSLSVLLSTVFGNRATPLVKLGISHSHVKFVCILQCTSTRYSFSPDIFCHQNGNSCLYSLRLLNVNFRVVNLKVTAYNLYFTIPSDHMA
jgi:hypothetical protein